MLAAPQAFRFAPGRVWLVCGRLFLAACVAASIGAIDVSWKSSALAAAGRVEVDAPGSLVRPLGTLAVGVLALAGVLLLPRVCLPGALLVVGGIAGNLASLALWHAVPNPLALPLAGGVLHTNLADLCVWSGCLLFLAGALWSIHRLPDERFA